MKIHLAQWLFIAYATLTVFEIPMHFEPLQPSMVAAV